MEIATLSPAGPGLWSSIKGKEYYCFPRTPTTLKVFLLALITLKSIFNNRFSVYSRRFHHEAHSITLRNPFSLPLLCLSNSYSMIFQIPNQYLSSQALIVSDHQFTFHYTIIISISSHKNCPITTTVFPIIRFTDTAKELLNY